MNEVMIQQKMTAIDKFLSLSKEKRFQGWSLVEKSKTTTKIPFFGESVNYKFKTGNGIEDYTFILRHFGWAVTFGIVNKTPDPYVVTLCQWKPGVNQASWELPPGGIGKMKERTIKEIETKTKEVYLRETGYGKGQWSYLGYVMIETAKYRGVDLKAHGFKAHLFLANNVEMVQAATPNPNEIIEIIPVPLKEFRNVLESGLFIEESAVACAYKSLIKLGALRWNE